MKRPVIALVTPALAEANNGNWQTARRWAGLLRATCRVRLMPAWNGGDEDLMIALHARRSAPSIAAWRAAGPRRPLAVALTGTDLYRDIEHDAEARRSLDQADALIVLNTLGARPLAPAWQAKTQVVLQSCRLRQPLPRPVRFLRAVTVGHLREEKDPQSVLRAMRQLAHRTDIRLDHLGRALDPALGEAARQLDGERAGYRWLGGVTHGEARRRIAAAHVLVHASRMEGGAHVLAEAVCSGTPVIATRIDGNVGLLGEHYPGFFPAGDDAALAACLVQARDDPAWLPHLQACCTGLVPRFTRQAESAALHAVLSRLLVPPPAASRGRPARQGG